MYKSGMIFAGVALLLGVGATLLSPMCTPCVALFLGLGAGYVACLFDKPLDTGASAKSGAVSGAIGGLGALLGQLVGAVLNVILVGPQGAADLLRQMGIETSGRMGGYWAGVIVSATCFSVLDVALMAGMGSLGALLWWQITGKKLVESELKGQVLDTAE